MSGKILTIFILSLLVITILPLSAIGEKSDTECNSNNSWFVSEGINNQAGVKVYNSGCCEGYTLLSFCSFNKSYESWCVSLIDMNGNEIKRWNSTIPDPAKMLSDGSIITGGDTIYTDKSETNLCQLDWNGNVVWNFSGWDDDSTVTLMSRSHHDFEREGNPVGYYAPGQDFVPFGKTLILGHLTTHNTSISKKTLLDDVIYEVNWNGTLTGFKWIASEHLDEMGFDSKARIGMWLNPGGPGLLLGSTPGDLLHINSVSYVGKNHWYDEDPIKYSYFNPENIIISSRHACFIAIISRETGKIVWRVGPDYSKNTEEGRKLGAIIGPHNAHMIPDGLPGAGGILVFDNGGVAGYGPFGFPSHIRLYSRVFEFNPITLEIVSEYKDRTGLTVFPRYGNLHKFFSPTMGSAQRLPNGNTLVTEALPGRVFELNQNNEIIWEFITPTRSTFLYRSYRVAPEWVPGNPRDYPSWED